MEVLIESDWNLKWLCTVLYHTGCQVLIESDWNLKKTAEILKYEGKSRINRIRLEFKGQYGAMGAIGKV